MSENISLFFRFLPDKDSVDRVRRTFTGLYTLDPVINHIAEKLLPFIEPFKVISPPHSPERNKTDIIYFRAQMGTVM